MPPISDSLEPKRNYGGGANPLLAAPLEASIGIRWRPAACLSVKRSQHPLDRACSLQELCELMRYSNRNESLTFVCHQDKEEVHVTTKDLRDLLSHSRPIADETIT